MNLMLTAMPIIIVILGLTIGLILFGLKNRVTGIKLMLLGISIIIFSCIIAVDPDTNLGGIEYLIAFSGLLVAIIGFGKSE